MWSAQACACMHLHHTPALIPHPEIAAQSASLAWGGVCPLWNMIPGINIPAACQLCCKMLAHGFPCVLIISLCCKMGDIFVFLLVAPLPGAMPYPPASSMGFGHILIWPPISVCGCSLWG